MSHKIKFRSVTDPVDAAATGEYPDGFGTYFEKPISELAGGALDRFTEDFGSFMRRTFPDMVVGDDLTVYHLRMTNAEMSERTRQIDLYLTGWYGYDEIDKTPL